MARRIAMGSGRAEPQVAAWLGLHYLATLRSIDLTPRFMLSWLFAAKAPTRMPLDFAARYPTRGQQDSLWQT